VLIFYQKMGFRHLGKRKEERGERKEERGEHRRTQRDGSVVLLFYQKMGFSHLWEGAYIESYL
jgi:ribosomal protein S18 acetylase RimI-like enzyme